MVVAIFQTERNLVEKKQHEIDKLIVEMNLPVLPSLFSSLCITSLTPGQLALIAPDMWLAEGKCSV